MKKLTALLLGLLMLGGIAGVVSADFNGYVLHVNVGDYTAYYQLIHKNPFAGTVYDVGNGNIFNVSYNVSILHVSYSGDSFCIPIQEVLIERSDNEIYAYGLYYCGAQEVSIMSNDTSFTANPATINVDPGDYNPPHGFGIEVSNDNNGGVITFYVDNSRVSSGSTSTAFSSVLQVRAGTDTTGATYDIYIDNIHEKAGIFAGGEDFEDQKDDYFLDDQHSESGVTKEIVPASSVPFFSDETTAGALALLLAVGAIWFFRRH
jgi:hypothetical protein